MLDKEIEEVFQDPIKYFYKKLNINSNVERSKSKQVF